MALTTVARGGLSSGALPALIPISSTTVTGSSVTDITIDNLPTTYDSYEFILMFHPTSDGPILYAKFIRNDGDVIENAHADYANPYTWHFMSDGTSYQDNYDPQMELGYGTGSANNEGIRATLRLTGRNYSGQTDSNQTAPHLFGHHIEFRTNGLVTGGAQYAGLDIYQNASDATVRGIKFYFSAGDIGTSSTVSVFGIQHP
tara:strand:+ start:164 stop:769 length:606 start_codon:yes stop_codon:yes gene_type:complete